MLGTVLAAMLALPAPRPTPVPTPLVEISVEGPDGKPAARGSSDRPREEASGPRGVEEDPFPRQEEVSVRRIAVWVLSMSVAVPGLASAIDLEAVIARHLEWRGGAAFQGLRSIERRGELRTAGLTGSISVLERRDGYRRIDYDLGAVKGSETVTPSDAWTTSGSGQIEDLGESLGRDARRALAHECGSLLLSDTLAARSLLGLEERDGRSWQVVRVDFADGGSYDYFLDPTSGAMTWARYTRDTDVVWIRYRDWRRVGAILMPYSEDQVFPNPDENTSVAWRDTAIDTELPVSRFARPEGRRVARIARGADSTGWTAFTFYQNQRILLPVTVNGIPTTAILDSGAEYTGLDAAFARQAGIAGAGTFAAQGSGGDALVSMARGVEMRLGALELRDLTVAVLDLGGVSKQVGAPLTVILGKELFNDMVVEIDYPARRIAFHDPARWSYRGGGSHVPLTKDRGLRKVPVSVEGRAPIRVGFDIGQGGALTLYRAYVEKEKLLEGRAPVSRQRGLGVGGATADAVGSVSTLAFGGWTLTNVPTTFVLDPAGSTDTTREQGNLGTEVFKRFRMIVDYSHDALHLEAAPLALRTPFSKDRSGLDVEQQGAALAVVFVAPGGPAEKAGWRVGERIIAIDGDAVGAGYATSDQWRWSQGEAGRIVALTLSSGETRRLKLENYY